MITCRIGLLLSMTFVCCAIQLQQQPPPVISSLADQKGKWIWVPEEQPRQTTTAPVLSQQHQVQPTKQHQVQPTKQHQIHPTKQHQIHPTKQHQNITQYSVNGMQQQNGHQQIQNPLNRMKNRQRVLPNNPKGQQPRSASPVPRPRTEEDSTSVQQQRGSEWTQMENPNPWTQAQTSRDRSPSSSMQQFRAGAYQPGVRQTPAWNQVEMPSKFNDPKHSWQPVWTDQENILPPDSNEPVTRFQTPNNIKGRQPVGQDDQSDANLKLQQERYREPLYEDSKVLLPSKTLPKPIALKLRRDQSNH